MRKLMTGVVLTGTGVKAQVPGYVVGGKTGTAQVVGIKANEKYNAAKVSEYQRDNALFISFAPADHPTIVLAMVVENVGFGAQYAGPIARRVMDYWIKGIYPTDADIAAVQAGTAGPPKTAGVPISLATNIRLGTNHSPDADDSAGTPLAGADDFAGAASAVAAFQAASGASAPTAAEHAAAVASAASAARAAAVDAALVNAGSGSVAVAASAVAKRRPSQWTPTPNPGKRKP
jgi:penicillin-binding protein 2